MGSDYFPWEAVSRDTAQAVSKENVEIVRRAIAAFNVGGYEATAEFVHPEIVFEEPPTQPGSKVARGVDDARQTLSAFDDAWEEHQSELEEIRDLGGPDVLVLTVEHLRGRDGIEFAQDSGAIYTLREGRIIRLRPFWERASALEAAGLSR